MSIVFDSVNLDPTIAQVLQRLHQEEGYDEPVTTDYEDLGLEDLESMLRTLDGEVEDHTRAIVIKWDEANFSVTCSLAKVRAILSDLDDILRAGNLEEKEIAAFYRQWGEFPSTDTIMYNIDPLGNLVETSEEATLGRYALENQLFAPEGEPVPEHLVDFLDLTEVGRYMGGHVYTVDETTWWQPSI